MAGNCALKIAVMADTTATALVPRPRRAAREIPLRLRAQGHRPRPRPAPARLLQGARQGPHPRSPAHRPRALLLQGCREEDQGGWWCCSARRVDGWEERDGGIQGLKPAVVDGLIS